MGELADTDLNAYPFYCFRVSHPLLTGAVGRLAGLATADMARARVLELGCGPGGNLAAMAVQFPEAQFVGVDLHGPSIESGKALAARAGPRNLDLRAGNILEVDRSWGEFDYVIAHGVYSWVPPEVQRHLLAVGREVMTDDGVMYVSLNAKPGWSARGIVREFMLRAAEEAGRAGAGQVERVKAARAAVEGFVAARAASGRAPEAMDLAFRAVAEKLKTSADAYVHQEFLSVFNEPLHLHEFEGRLSEAGLAYLSDVRLRLDGTADLPQGLATRVQSAGPESRGYVLEYARNRFFREAVVCKAGRKAAVEGTAGRMSGLWYSGTARRVATAPAFGFPATGNAEQWRTPAGYGVGAKLAWQSAVLRALEAAIPGAVSFSALLSAARGAGGTGGATGAAGVSAGAGGSGGAVGGAGGGGASTGAGGGADGGGGGGVTEAALAEYLWGLTMSTDAIEPVTGAWAVSAEAGERPVACPLARAMAESGMDAVFGRGQQRWPLKPEWRELLLACDGRARSELPGGVQREATLAAIVRAGLLVP